jgi:exopolysaccharide biosynthesis protein
LQKEQIVSDHLYTELSQGTEIVHCADEVAADFHTKEMQEWLIEKRHPRTALGITHDNQLCIVVVDGRLQESEGA